jgi:hypothetical protein
MNLKCLILPRNEITFLFGFITYQKRRVKISSDRKTFQLKGKKISPQKEKTLFIFMFGKIDVSAKGIETGHVRQNNEADQKYSQRFPLMVV